MRSITMMLMAISMSIVACSCSKEKDNIEGNYGDHPRTTVPDELTGYWLAGSTSISSFWGYDGSYQGAAGIFNMMMVLPWILNNPGNRRNNRK